MENNGKIYGVSSKYDMFRRKWTHYVRVFTNSEVAEKWLHTEEYDFRERELFTSRSAAVKLAGNKAIKAAEEVI